MKKYDVIIIGAGPSGISTALNLVKLGIKNILVVEKYKFPRYKCCAGYITSKTKKVYEELGLNLEECHYTLIKDFNIFYKLKLKQTIINKFLYTNRKIERVELDDAFYKLAVNKKINIIEKTTITNHDIYNNTITLSNNQTSQYNYLVFADGTNSFGNRYQKENKKHIAMQMVFENTSREEIQIHFGITKKGYAWVSSCHGWTNVGLTDVYNEETDYRKIFKDFLKNLGIEKDIIDLKGAFTPIGIRTPVINHNIFFVGDAVGACDPLTLSGLRYGLKTGEYCAKAIKNKNNKIYHKYIRNIKVKFIFMKLLLKVFYLKITLFCIFEIGCRFFGKLISKVFNDFFVNKK